MRRERLAYFRYCVNAAALENSTPPPADASIEALVAQGFVRAEPLLYRFQLARPSATV